MIISLLSELLLPKNKVVNYTFFICVSAEIEPEITLVLFLYLPKYSPLPKVEYLPLLYIPYYIPFSISKTLKGFSDRSYSY